MNQMKNLLNMHLASADKHREKYKNATNTYAKTYDPRDPTESKRHSSAFRAMNHHKHALDAHEIAAAHLKANTPSAVFYSNQANMWSMKPVNESLKTFKEFLDEARKIMYPRKTGTSPGQAAGIGQQKHAIRDTHIDDVNSPEYHKDEIHDYKYLLSKTPKDSPLHKNYTDKLAHHTAEHARLTNG